ncbi:mycofactocin biosynthesis peptidyl-dipeptidase MftE [Saccharomonospora sp. NPDC046836]|uniref:mycofactocin biosynthesis peptidyl-dipeptidase MftE n=1 Tax=Saccharomonospora sp. NPDC046836 TaxID=3156921 RepID=UPI0033D0D1FA
MTSLGRCRWPEIGPAVLAVPLGATEQHGPHLPLDTDTAVATELCRRLAERLPGVLVAPALPFGSSGEHAGFPGTLSIGQEAFERVVVELARSAEEFDGIVFVNGHGGNLAPLRRAVRLLRAEGRPVFAWAPSGRADDAHAGRTETSVMLRLRPADVELTAAEAGNTTPLPDLMEQLVRGGVRAVSDNGVLGDPSGASAEEGEALLATWADALVTAVRGWLTR